MTQAVPRTNRSLGQWTGLALLAVLIPVALSSCSFFSKDGVEVASKSKQNPMGTGKAVAGRDLAKLEVALEWPTEVGVLSFTLEQGDGPPVLTIAEHSRLLDLSPTQRRRRLSACNCDGPSRARIAPQKARFPVEQRVAAELLAQIRDFVEGAGSTRHESALEFCRADVLSHRSDFGGHVVVSLGASATPRDFRLRRVVNLEDRACGTKYVSPFLPGENHGAGVCAWKRLVDSVQTAAVSAVKSQGERGSFRLLGEGADSSDDVVGNFFRGLRCANGADSKSPTSPSDDGPQNGDGQ